MQYDFVAIGDITTDAFIKLKDAEELMDHGVRELCVRFGDKVPYESVTEIRAVGNAANAAVSAHRIGLTSALVAWVGDDEHGKETIETLRAQGVSDEFMTTEAGKQTNYHYVLMYGPERVLRRTSGNKTRLSTGHVPDQTWRPRTQRYLCSDPDILLQ
jgi:sugar/nucleoside kinase (ribokinase family)